jgi:class 3 adenylate cyclase
MDIPSIQYASTSDGVNIAYTQFGEGPLLVETPMMLFNVPPALLAEERTFYERLAEGRTFVSYDSRGVGQSDPAPSALSAETALRDLEAVIDAVGTATVSILGSGHGVPVAIAYAARWPERTADLVLLNGYLRGSDVTEQSSVVAARGMMDSDYRMWLEGVMHWAGAPGQSSASHIAGNAARAIPPDMMTEFQASFAEVDESEEAATVQARTLVVARRENRIIPASLSRGIAAAIPGARLAHLEGAEQLAAWGDIDELASTVLDFLAEGATTDEVQLSGFQTILFTDLESSTALTQRVGDEAAQEVIRGHNVAVRAALEEHGGREVKHTGDGIMASFPSAVSAVQAALAIQRELAGGEVRVRVGLNAGEPIAEDDDLFGTAVQLAARIVDRAEPGQVLVSNVVRELCAGKTFEFTSIGETTLKGFDEPVALYETRA